MCLTLYIFARLSINKFYIQISFHVVFPMFWFFFITFQNGLCYRYTVHSELIENFAESSTKLF